MIKQILISFSIITIFLDAQNTASNSTTGLTYSTIQNAINAATNNYIVYIYSNTSEWLTVYGKTNLTITKAAEISSNPILEKVGGIGFEITNSYNISISHLILKKYYYGINAAQCNNMMIQNINFVTNLANAIFISDSLNTIITSNSFYSNSCSTDLPWQRSAIFLNRVAHCYVFSNNFYNNLDKGIILNFCTNMLISNNYFLSNKNGALMLYNSCQNNIISNFFSSNGNGITLKSECQSNIIKWNLIEKNTTLGIDFEPSPFDNNSYGNIITENIIRYTYSYGAICFSSGPNYILDTIISSNSIYGNTNGYGIYLRGYVTNSKISCNRIFENSNGIRLYSSAYSVINNNDIISNQNHGIFFDGVNPNNWQVFSNNICCNKNTGIYLFPANDNQIAYNNITNNSNGIIDTDFNYFDSIIYNNIFDNTYANCSSYSVLYASNNYFGQRNWNDKKINASINTWTPWANSFMNFTTDWTSPAIPGNINAVKNTSYEIVLSWNAVADNDFSNYNIFRTTEANCNYLSDSNIISKVYTKTTTSFTNTITQPGNYYYYITAVDIYSNESWYSSCSPIITVEQITNPTISSCTPIATNAIIIDWIDLSNEDAYLLYRSTVSNTNTAILISAILSNVNHYTNNNLLPNTTYYYWLKSSNISGVSKHSTAVCATTYPMIPDVPIIQSVIVNSPNDITVTWQDVARETAYLLYTNTETNTAGASICTTLAADVTSYNNTGLKVLTKYYYWLKSSNISGMSDFSATTSGTTLKEYDIIAPNIVFMPTNGLFLTNILLSIAASDNETISEKIKIYYTFDEKEPQMKDENRYSEKILFKTGHTYIISAIAVDEMGNRASILNQKYTIDCFADMTLNQKTKEILSHLSSVQAIELKGMGYKEKEIEYLATAKDDVTATIITEPSQPVGIMLKSLQGGFIVKKIHIKNLDGTIVQEIQCSGFNNNVMMVYWDKNTRNGSRVKTGIYVISIEYFDNNVPKNITRLLVVAN